MIILQQFSLRHFLPILMMFGFYTTPIGLCAKEMRHHQSSTSKHSKSNIGMASFYAAKFQGRHTANGEIFSNNAMTAAHRSLPFGTQVKVTNVKNARSVVVRINDRGPYAKSRIIDLTKAAAKKIGITHSGVARVKLEVLNKNKAIRAINQSEMNPFLQDAIKQQ